MNKFKEELVVLAVGLLASWVLYDKFPGGETASYWMLGMTAFFLVIVYAIKRA